MITKQENTEVELFDIMLRMLIMVKQNNVYVAGHGTMTADLGTVQIF